MSYIGKAPSEQGSRGEYIGSEPTLVITPPVVNPYTGDIPVNVLVLSTFNITASATRWAVGYGQVTLGTSETQIMISDDCTCDFMAANINANPAATIVYTLRKNGIDTTQTVTLSSGTQKATDSAHPIHFRRGETFSVKLVSGAIGASTIDGTVTLRFVKYGTNQGLPCLWVTNDAVSATALMNGLGMFNGTVASTGLRGQMPFPATSIMVDPNHVGSSSLSYRNGVATPVTTLGGLPNPEGRTEVPFDLAAGETFAYQQQSTLSPQTMNGGLRVGQPLGSTLYPKAHFMFGGDPLLSNVTRYMGNLGKVNNSELANGSITESEMQFIPPPCKFKELYAFIDTPTAAGQTYTVTLRKNGAATGITVQFNNSSPSVLSETATEVTFNGTTDLATIQAVGTASPGTRYLHGSLQIYRV